MPEARKVWNSKFIRIAITSLLMYGVFYGLNPILPIYGSQIGLNSSDIGIMLSSMSITTILFRPLAGYIIDSFNRFKVFLIFLFFLCVSFLGYTFFHDLPGLIFVRLFTGAVWSVCGSTIITLASDNLPINKIGMGMNRFTLTVALGMAVGPFIGIQIQNGFSSTASFYVMFGMIFVGLIIVFSTNLKYKKAERKKFQISNFFYGPALPFMFNMTFMMIPYGAFLAYSAMFAREKGLMSSIALFYVFLSVGLIVSKLLTQKLIDSGRYRAVVGASLVLLFAAMFMFQYVTLPVHMFAIALVLGLGYGILQPLFQSMVSSISPGPKRGVANSTYLLAYDIGIGIGAIFMGLVGDSIGIGKGYAYTAAGYVIAAVIFYLYCYRHYQRRLSQKDTDVTLRN